MEPSDIFRDNVYRLIKREKLVQAHIAEQIGEKPQSFNDYLKGRIGWGEEKRKKLAAYLEVEYHELYNQHFMAGTTAGIKLGEEADADVIRSGNVMELNHSDIIKRFKNKLLAKAINERLLRLENMDPAALDKVMGYLEGMLAGYQSSYTDRRKSDQPEKIPKTGDRRKAAG